MKLIGINGLKTSGKDTTFSLVEQIAAESGLVAQRVAFADKLKIVAMLALGIERTPENLVLLADAMKNGAGINVIYDEPGIADIPYLNEDLSTMHFLTGRAYLQNLGNYARWVFGENFWIDQVLPFAGQYSQLALEAKYPKADILVVTDARYANEAHRIRSLGGEVWEVIRPGIESDGHVSEEALSRDLVDQQLLNDGTILDLSLKVRKLMP